jgi:predicted alpha/beta superfamily hydrolase
MVQAQTENLVSIGFKDSVYSKVLKENREILLYLPADYAPYNRYPVAYLLDGEDHFHFLTGLISTLSRSSLIPDMIVVGVVNTKRNRDLTPNYDSLNYDKANGGGELFTLFLEKELMPFIQEHYAAAPYKILIGHSLGGLLVINTLVNHSTLFNAYIALEPSLWWDKMKVVKQFSSQRSENIFKAKSLFMAVASTAPGKAQRAAIMKDTSTSSLGFRSLILFDDILTEAAHKGLKSQTKFYENETHSSVPIIGALDGLKFIFDFYKRPSFPVLTDSSSVILENHYRKISETMGYKILPSEYDLAGLAWRSRVMEKNFYRAFNFLQLYIRLYPESAAAYNSMGQYYEARGDKSKARSYFDQAQALREKGQGSTHPR